MSSMEVTYHLTDCSVGVFYRFDGSTCKSIEICFLTDKRKRLLLQILVIAHRKTLWDLLMVIVMKKIFFFLKYAQYGSNQTFGFDTRSSEGYFINYRKDSDI